MVRNVGRTRAVGTGKTITTRQGRITRRALRQTASTLAIRIVDGHVIAGMERMRIDTSLFAELQHHEWLGRRRRTMADLHRAIDRIIIALRHREGLIGRAHVIVFNRNLFFRRASRHAGPNECGGRDECHSIHELFQNRHGFSVSRSMGYTRVRGVIPVNVIARLSPWLRPERRRSIKWHQTLIGEFGLVSP